jgi:hypothetical protein
VRNDDEGRRERRADGGDTEGRESRCTGAEVARRRYNVSFVVSCLLYGGNIGGKMV